MKPLRRTAPEPGLYGLVERERDALDKLLSELADGPRSAAHYDALEAQAAAIGVGLLAAFRRCKAA